jgi:hypothetical protein
MAAQQKQTADRSSKLHSLHALLKLPDQGDIHVDNKLG